MLDEVAARAAAAPELKTASAAVPSMRLGAARELALGWFFPFEADKGFAGSNGVIVNKRSGEVLVLGSAFSNERNLALYDRGYHWDRCDLTITAVVDHAATLRVLGKLIQVTDESFEHGTHWRIPRAITAAELTTRLRDLPCRFASVATFFHWEDLEQARTKGWFALELAAPSS